MFRDNPYGTAGLVLCFLSMGVALGGGRGQIVTVVSTLLFVLAVVCYIIGQNKGEDNF